MVRRVTWKAIVLVHWRWSSSISAFSLCNFPVAACMLCEVGVPVVVVKTEKQRGHLSSMEAAAVLLKITDLRAIGMVLNLQGTSSTQR